MSTFSLKSTIVVLSWMKTCMLLYSLCAHWSDKHLDVKLYSFFPHLAGFQGRGGRIPNLWSPGQHRLSFPCRRLPALPGYMPGTVWTTEPLLLVHAASSGDVIIRRAVCRRNGQRGGPDLERWVVCGANCMRVRSLLHPHRLLATVLLHEVREFYL